MAKNSSKLAGKIFPDAFKRADEIKQLPLAQLDQSIKELVKLGECVEILSGFAFKSDLFNTEKNGMPLIRIRDVVPAKTETYYSGDYLDDYLINNDDLLIGMDGDFNREKWQGGKALLNQRVCKISAVPSILNQDYLYHFLPKALLKIHSETPAVTVKHLSVKTIKEIEIPLPPLAEQKRIAAILDKADAIRRKRQQAIELADEFLRSVFLDMFGDPVTNPKDFPVGTIRDLVDSVNYGTSSKASEIDGAYPILRMGNITYNGDWDFTSLKYIDLAEKEKAKYLVSKGDLLFNRTNSKELVGKTAVYEEDKPMAIAGYLIRVRPNSDGNNHYISGYLNSMHGKEILIAMCKNIVGMANINAQELQDIKILIPPKKYQDQYANIVIATKSKVKKLKQALAEADILFKALSQRAFAGEL